MSPDFDRLKMYYTKRWASDAQLQMYVKFGMITDEEYTLITGKVLPAA